MNFSRTHTNTVFNPLPCIPDVLHIELYDEDFGGIRDEYIGDAEVLYEKLLDGEYVTLNIYNAFSKKYSIIIKKC